MNDYLTPHTKAISKWIKDLNIKSETIKLQKENLGIRFFDFDFDDEFFLNLIPKERQQKQNMNK